MKTEPMNDGNDQLRRTYQLNHRSCEELVKCWKALTYLLANLHLRRN